MYSVYDEICQNTPNEKESPINKCASTRIEPNCIEKSDKDERERQKRVCAFFIQSTWLLSLLLLLKYGRQREYKTARVDWMVTRVFTVRCTIEY